MISPSIFRVDSVFEGSNLFYNIYRMSIYSAGLMGGKRGKWLIQVLNTVKLLAAPGSLLVEWATRMESQLWPFLCQFSCDFLPRMNYKMLQLILPFRSQVFLSTVMVFSFNFGSDSSDQDQKKEGSLGDERPSDISWRNAEEIFLDDSHLCALGLNLHQWMWTPLMLSLFS